MQEQWRVGKGGGSAPSPFLAVVAQALEWDPLRPPQDPSNPQVSELGRAVE